MPIVGVQYLSVDIIPPTSTGDWAVWICCSGSHKNHAGPGPKDRKSHKKWFLWTTYPSCHMYKYKQLSIIKYCTYILWHPVPLRQSWIENVWILLIHHFPLGEAPASALLPLPVVTVPRYERSRWLFRRRGTIELRYFSNKNGGFHKKKSDLPSGYD